MALGKIFLAGHSGQPRLHKIAPSLTLGQPITGQGFIQNHVINVSKFMTLLAQNNFDKTRKSFSNFTLLFFSIEFFDLYSQEQHSGTAGLRWQILPLANLENTKLNKDASSTLKINDDIIPIPFHVSTSKIRVQSSCSGMPWLKINLKKVFPRGILPGNEAAKRV